ncbi:MAG: ATP-binding protein, partial [Bacteroidota bacterium]
NNSKVNVSYYPIKHGLHYGNNMAMAKNKIIVGNEKGLLYFSPDELLKTNPAPKIALIDFRLFNQSVPIGKIYNGHIPLKENLNTTDTIHLSYLDNMVSFKFAGIEVNNPQELRYAYKLEGLHEDWIYTDATERIAHFTNLPYESLRFKVKASQSKGDWGPIKSITLIVSPPFWKTKWAYLIWSIAFLALLFGLFKVLSLRSKFQYQLQLEKIEREKLQAINQMKLRFFTNISHELRTPLTLIISPLEQFIKRKSLAKKDHLSLLRMHKNARRLLHMINQLLDIRKGEAGLRKLKVAEGNFVKFAHEIILSFKSLAMDKEISLMFSSSKDEIRLWYDRDEMEKVLFNLLSNALKFTPEKGKITLSLQQHERALIIGVADSGMGIPNSQKQQIFDRYYQLEENPDESRFGSSGIGLALSKSIVKSHNGTIWVEDNPSGQGSIFYIQLRLGDQHFKSEEKIISFVDSEAISNYLQPEKISRYISSTKIQPTTSPTDLPLLLLVEDNFDIRAYMKENLQDKYRIIEAGDGKEGLNISLKEIPDLIIADISMPEMN